MTFQGQDPSSILGTGNPCHCSVMEAYPVECEPGGGGSKPPNDKNGINLPGFIQFTNILYNVTTYYSKISTHI